MKKLINYFLFVALVLVGITSCESDDNNDTTLTPRVDDTTPTTTDTTVITSKIAYIINYGSYSGAKTEISRFDLQNSTINNLFYKSQNNGLSLTSNIQFAYTYNDNIYLLGNNSDQLITVNKNFIQSTNGLTDKIQKPRCCAGDGNYLYVSCWGSNPDWGKMPNTYIAKFNVNTGLVEDTVLLPGGPEGVEVSNGKLFVALNYKDSVAVIDLANFKASKSYIATPAVCSYFVKDASGNLYVSLVSTYTHPSNFAGLGYINATTSSLDATYKLSDVSSNYTSIMAINKAKSKIYMITGAYDANWKYSGSVSYFDLNSKAFTKNVITGISGINGLSVNPTTDYLYVLTTNGSSAAGKVNVYNPASSYSLMKEETTGIAPAMAIYPN